jgi:hypothetical protein
MFVGKLTDLCMVENVQVTVAVVTPSGYLLCADAESDGLSIDLMRQSVAKPLR